MGGRQSHHSDVSGRAALQATNNDATTSTKTPVVRKPNGQERSTETKEKEEMKEENRLTISKKKVNQPSSLRVPTSPGMNYHDSHLQFELVMTQAQQLVSQTANEWFDMIQTTCRQTDSTGTTSMMTLEFITTIATTLAQLDSAYRSSLNQLTQQNTGLRQQLELQSEEFIRLQLQLESFTLQTKNQQSDELSRIRIEEMMKREKETDALSRQLAADESKFSAEKLAIEQEKAREIANLKARADEIIKKLESLSSNAAVLMPDEAEAIATGEGELKRIRIQASEHFGGHTPEEFHFRLAESQFLRMGGAGYKVTSVEYILNPPLLKRYYDFKQKLKDSGEPVQERLTFHGTSMDAIEAIIKEGFCIGPRGSLGLGVYSSESPTFAMLYIRGGRTSLLFSRVTPSKDSVIAKSCNVIQQLVCMHPEQIMPAYIVHYAKAAAP